MVYPYFSSVFASCRTSKIIKKKKNAIFSLSEVSSVEKCFVYTYFRPITFAVNPQKPSNDVTNVGPCNKLCILSFIQREHLKEAQQFFQLVGGSASESGMCQTGRSISK